MSEFFEWPSLVEIVAAVKSGKFKAQDQVQRSLDLIAQFNPEYNPIIQTCSERALKRAKDIDSQISSGNTEGRLLGVPFIAKDNFLTFGSETTAASNMLKGFNAPYQSSAIELLEAEGAICVAKANLDAFAHGGSTENSDYGVVANPHDKSRVAGGSSGGSAASVALGLAPFALGTDTGGSIRQPASFCGVVGYKPTYGLVSRSGVVAMASSTDVIGTLSRSVEDAAIVIDIISGKDILDSTTIDRIENYTIQEGVDSLRGKKIGVIKEYMNSNLDHRIRELIDIQIKKFVELGAEVNEVSIPSIDKALAVYYVVVPAELSSNLSRHDGQRYQFSDEDAKTLEESYLGSRSKGFGREAKRRIMIGTHVLSSGYYDAYYKKAQTVRTKLVDEFNAVFEDCDFLIGPVTPDIAFKIGALSEDPIKMYLQDIMTVAVNLVGIPAVSIPAGFKDEMPVGLQIMAAQKKDSELLQIAYEIAEVSK